MAMMQHRCPLAFLSSGMAASFMNEIIALANNPERRNPQTETDSGQLLYDEGLNAQTHPSWGR